MDSAFVVRVDPERLTFFVDYGVWDPHPQQRELVSVLVIAFGEEFVEKDAGLQVGVWVVLELREFHFVQQFLICFNLVELYFGKYSLFSLLTKANKLDEKTKRKYNTVCSLRWSRHQALFLPAGNPSIVMRSMIQSAKYWFSASLVDVLAVYSLLWNI